MSLKYKYVHKHYKRMLYVINSIQSRQSQANKTYQDLLSLGIDQKDIIIDNGYTMADFPDLPQNKKHHLLHYNLFDRLLPFAIERKIDLVYMEDSIKPLGKVSDFDIDREKINWLGYIWENTHYICGAKMVHIPYHICTRLYKNRNKLRPQFIDRLFRNYGLKHDCLNLSPKSKIRIYKDESSWGNSKYQKDRKEKAKAKLYV